MRCDKCNVDIVCKTNICPLCHSEIKDEGAFPVCYAKVQKKRGRRQISFSKWYLSLSLLIVVIAAIINFIFSKNGYWTLLTIGFVIYLYFCIRITFLSYKHLNMKIFGQTAALTALGILLDRLITIKIYVFEIILPIIFLAAILAVFINIIMNIDNARSYLISFFLIAILGVIPLIVVLIKQELLWPSLSVATISLLILSGLAILARKKISEEFARVFHR